ncbi:MAG: YbbR-like domain-containing protein [Desulfuromonadaceae bacterium]|nr:YbbR-like domain-containing protein [Desulfuromonadaceae bacterium]
MVKIIMENWFLKLLSLTFAVILWFFVMGEQRLEQGYSASLQLRNIPKGLMIANDVPSTIDVRISGPRTLLMNLKPSEVRLSVDLTGLKAGVTSFKRLEEQLNLPTALKVTRLSPPVIDVRLEAIQKKIIPVRVILKGELPAVANIGGVYPNPAQVEIEGAKSELKKINEAVTDPVEIDGAMADVETSVALIPLGQYVSFSQKQNIQVKVAIIVDTDGPPSAQEEKHGE